jgi:YVTN family beta-propeller protein
LGDASFPVALAADPTCSWVYAANFYSNNVSVISESTNQVIAKLGVGDLEYSPSTLVVDSGNGHVHVPNFYSGTVSILQSSTTTTTITASTTTSIS